MDRGWKPNVEISPTCPRCGSTNTKFCYYNNYSLTQPRYFCKGCRRYWTKGGSLRNVPVGGGCRKSRRGKPIRASFDGVTSRSFASSGTALGHCGTTGLGSYNGSTPVLPTSTGSLAGADGPNIDLALVYENFLNPKSSEPEPRLEIPELPNVVGPSFHQFSSIETMHMELSNAQLAQESVFLDYRFISDSSSDTPMMSEGNPFYLGGIDSFGRQHIEDNHFNCPNQMNNYLLPPLPGDETVSEGRVWPNSDLMCPSHPVHATQSTGNLPEVQDLNQLEKNVSSMFRIPNYGISSGRDK